MKIVIFGATGRAGKRVLQQAIQRGYEVTVFVRSPDRLGDARSKVKIVQGDILNQALVSQAIHGNHAVISVLGPTRNEPIFEVSQGIRHILTGMQEHGVRRLVLSTGAGVGDPNDEPKLMDKIIHFLLKRLSRYVYEDMLRTVEIVRQSALDWTIVRAPMLTDDPMQGQVKIGWVGKGTNARLSRADMASFMLDQIDSETYRHQAPVISN